MTHSYNFSQLPRTTDRTMTAPLPSHCFVMKAEELGALNHLAPDHPQPTSLTWINRGTDQAMRRTTIEMLLRTLFRDGGSPSVVRLHQTSGLRAAFASEADRLAFGRAFAAACAIERRKQRESVTAVFDQPAAAENAFRDLVAAGVRQRAISLLWRAGQFIEGNQVEPPRGHSRMSVAAASAGGGLAGAIFGISLLTIPGLGLVAAGGAIAAQVAGAVGAVGGIFGATGAAYARMLSDFDVDDRAREYYARAIKRGKVFVSVDPAACKIPLARVRSVLAEAGGRFAVAMPANDPDDAPPDPLATFRDLPSPGEAR